jgi:hypothetical protein
MFREVLAVTLRLMARHRSIGAAMAIRELVQDGGRSWGQGLMFAECMASAGRQGEILLDPAIDAVAGQVLATVGEVDVEIGGFTLSAALMHAGAVPVAGVRSSLPPDLNAEPLSWRTSSPRARELSPAAELLTSPEPVTFAASDPRNADVSDGVDTANVDNRELAEEAVELSSSAIDSAVPTPNAVDRALAHAELLAQTVGPISVDEDRPTLADSPRASSRQPAIEVISVSVVGQQSQHGSPAESGGPSNGVYAGGAQDAAHTAEADIHASHEPAPPERRTLPSSAAPAAQPNPELEMYAEAAPGTLPSSELLDVPSRVTPVGPPPRLHHSHAPAAPQPAHGLPSSNPPALGSSLPPEDRSSQMRPPPKPSTRSSVPDLPAYPLPTQPALPTQTAAPTQTPVPAPTPGTSQTVVAQIAPLAVISMPPPRASAPPPKPAGKSRAPGRRMSEPPPKPSRTPSDVEAERTSAIEALLADDTSALRDRPLGPAAADRELDRELEHWIKGEAHGAGDGDLGMLRLREAARTAQQRQAPNQARTRLALAAALERVGRSREAYLESLSALARAREIRDASVQRASARLIAQLTRKAGFEQAAVQWDELGA